jgi:hypothetical protein
MRGVKLRIVSDGTSAGTHVRTLDGRELAGVQEITWKLTAPGVAEVTLRVNRVEIDVKGTLPTLAEDDAG